MSEWVYNIKTPFYSLLRNLKIYCFRKSIASCFRFTCFLPFSQESRNFPREAQLSKLIWLEKQQQQHRATEKVFFLPSKLYATGKAIIRVAFFLFLLQSIRSSRWWQRKDIICFSSVSTWDRNIRKKRSYVCFPSSIRKRRRRWKIRIALLSGQKY